ncbi:MAG: rRNA maturation RNase YbeY [Clostridium sp.]
MLENIDIEYDEDIVKELTEISTKLDKNITDFKEIVSNIVLKTISKGYEIENISKKVGINILITNDDKIKNINNETRNIDKITDVLSFPAYDDIKNAPIYTETEYPIILGDIVINISRIYEQSMEYGTGFNRELSYMITHSFYHLLGYDHEIVEDKKVMRAKEEYLLNLINI